MKRLLSVLGGTLGILIVLFVMREWQISKTQGLRILGEKNAALVTLKGRAFSFGNSNQEVFLMGKGSLLSYFSEPIISLDDIEEGKQYEEENVILQKLSSNIIKGNFEGERVWFINEFSEKELESVQQQSIPLSADIWVLQTNNFPLFFPVPKQAILFLGERKPSKSLETFAQQKQIPLISVSQTQGVLLEREKNKWNIKTRK